MKIQKTNIYAIDALRTLSILAVILIHTTSQVLEKNGYDLNGHIITLILNQISRFAVPLFFLLSGFVLELNFHLNESYWHYLKKRVNRIFIPFIFWSAVYYILIYPGNSDNFIKAIFVGSASYQLYFIPSLIIFYLIFPIIYKFYKFILNKWVLIVLGILQIWILYEDYRVRHISINFPVAVTLFNYYVFLLGMVAARNYEKILSIVSKLKYLILAGLVIAAWFVFWQGKTFYYQTYNIGAFYSQWRPSVLIYTLLFGAAAFYFFSKVGWGKAFIKKLSKLSFLVFFIHVMILEEVWKFIGAGWKNWLDLPFFLTVSAISFIVAFIIHKIPYLNKITG